MTPATVPSRPSLRVAFYGRVACDTDGTAMTTIASQYEQCRRALPPDAILAIFYDIGSDSAFRRHPGRLTVGDRRLPRDGGLEDLLAEAARPSRRFDHLVACSPDRLSRRMEHMRDLLNRLRLARVQPLFPVADGPAAAYPTDVIDLICGATPRRAETGSRRAGRRGGAR